ncbi:MAG TPA: glyceraldehyde 3-phosphate dehydrogenase NAD-binding domain-containing protein [Bacteroidales bacterium]|nr:glyceraldehyde 3-phosphate dehydrogenase NAD-binding domain-containing protein [Bacteroidales bacterium]
MDRIRVGIMGFGEVGRHIFRQCLKEDRIEIVAIADLGRPEILDYLLKAETKGGIDVKLEGNFLVSRNGRARMIQGRHLEPGDVLWDSLDVDVAIDGTGIYKSRADMERHLKAGARRVVLTTLPTDDIDRVVVQGVNDHTIKASDRMVSAGSATTNATALMLKILDEAFGVDYAMLTTVHSYTSDQPLRDKASTDFRRSRSAAENIIPNETPSPRWIQHIMPEFKGRIEGSALNVPVPNGSLLDLTTILKSTGVTKEQVNAAVTEYAKKHPKVVRVVNDPIVSTDVIGDKHSVNFDLQATMMSPGRMVKTLTWYHTALATANRIIDLIIDYAELEKKGGAK